MELVFIDVEGSGSDAKYFYEGITNILYIWCGYDLHSSSINVTGFPSNKSPNIMAHQLSTNL